MKPIKLSQSLPQHAYSGIQVLEHEAEVANQCGMSLFSLMQSAGQSVFDHLVNNYVNVQKIVVVCGKGNNGGDGFIVASLAEKSGIKATVLVLTHDQQLVGDAKKAYENLPCEGIDVIHSTDFKNASEIMQTVDCDVIIDAIFGIGFHGKLSTDYQHIINAINSHKTPVISIDIPSGLNATTGIAQSGAITAHSTVTFIVIKTGLVTAKAANYIGELYLADLSIGEKFQRLITSNIFIQGEKVLTLPPPRMRSSHKGQSGLVLSFGGNVGMPGAIRLSAEASLRCGAGLVAVYCHVDCAPIVAAGRPELMLPVYDPATFKRSSMFEKARVLCIGPGLGTDDWAKSIFNVLIQSSKMQIVDADGLVLLSQTPIFNNNRVLTPHPKEAAQLLNCTVDEVESNRLKAANNIVKKYGGICVLKGAGSLVCDEHSCWINTSGNPGMASGGMGDVLSGIIAALLLQFEQPIDAVRCAVYIHGAAADIIANKQGEKGLLASDLFLPLQRLVNSL